MRRSRQANNRSQFHHRLVPIPWMATVAGMDLGRASWAMLVFVPGDLFKALLAAIIAQRVRVAIATV